MVLGIHYFRKEIFIRTGGTADGDVAAAATDVDVHLEYVQVNWGLGGRGEDGSALTKEEERRRAVGWG